MNYAEHEAIIYIIYAIEDSSQAHQYSTLGGAAFHRPKLSGFAEVGHHILPTFPLETVCARKRSAPLTHQALGAPPVLGSFDVRRKRGGVVCHALDRGMVGALRL